MAYRTITKPLDYFNTKIYTGNDSTQSITGIGFQPDLWWNKSRSGTHSAGVHCLYDSVRGVTKRLQSNATTAEATISGVTAFDSDGVTLGSENQSNGGSTNYVAWNWKAGTTSGITQGGASITPTAYSFNQTAGFSIIKYTGGGGVATVPHGLGTAPAVIILRNTTDAENWVVYHHKNTSAPETDYLLLNSNQATTDGNTVWNDVAPTANLFTIGASGAVSGNGDNHIAYCFAEKKGYSKFGKYTANASTDGPFLYCGFKPKFLMVKRTNQAAPWSMIDASRNTYNPANLELQADVTNAEANQVDGCDFLSNGVKLRDSADMNSGSGDTFIFMAFAEEPLVANVGSTIPSTAR